MSMEIGPRMGMVWYRSINGQDFRFTRREDDQTVTLTVEEWEPFYGVWKGEWQGTYRHTLRLRKVKR